MNIHTHNIGCASNALGSASKGFADHYRPLLSLRIIGEPVGCPQTSSELNTRPFLGCQQDRNKGQIVKVACRHLPKALNCARSGRISCQIKSQGKHDCASVLYAQNSFSRRFLNKWIGPALLFLMVAGFHWKLVLTNQFTWLESPDLVNQVLPWFQFQAGEWHAGHFPQ